MPKHAKHIAIYCRVSTTRQELRSQLPDLERWAATQELPVVWYQDKATGRNTDRPGWQRLESAMRSGQVASLVCWRLDRLGRNAKGLHELFETLQQRKINFVSLREGIDLSTPAGRMMAGVLASLAQFESELLRERINAGIQAAKASGKRWGGSKPGSPTKLTPAVVRTIKRLKEDGESVSAIARTVQVSRPRVYAALAD